MNEIKISIIIPAYNISQYIQNCLKSVMNQTWKNIEIIVVDDGSTDNTAEIVESYLEKDRRIKLIRKTNGGVTSARLSGIAEATGEFIGFVDGDDIIEPDMYEHLLHNAIKYSADISHCGYQMVFPDHVDYYYNTGQFIQQSTQEGLRDLFTGSFVEPGLWNKLYHIRLFHSLLYDGVMDLSIKNNEDLLMNYYLFKESQNAIYEDWCPYHYIIRKGSATSKRINEHQLFDPIRTINILIDKTSGNDEAQLILLQRLMRQWIRLATMPAKDNTALILLYKKRAKHYIRKNMGSCLKKHGFNFKLKIMILWVAIWPWSYEKIHMIHDCITGNNKKYHVD